MTTNAPSRAWFSLDRISSAGVWHRYGVTVLGAGVLVAALVFVLGALSLGLSWEDLPRFYSEALSRSGAERWLPVAAACAIPLLLGALDGNRLVCGLFALAGLAALLGCAWFLTVILSSHISPTGTASYMLLWLGMLYVFGTITFSFAKASRLSRAESLVFRLFAPREGMLSRLSRAVGLPASNRLCDPITALAVIIVNSLGALLTSLGALAPVLVFYFTYLGLTAAPLLLVLGSGCRMVARGLARRSMADAVRHDKRPHILFLRSFQDDQVTVPSGGRAWLRLIQGRLGKRRLDHLLVEDFSHYGPVVAIGRPGEQHLPFGAARHYVDDLHWQQQVSALATNALAIVVVADTSPGLQWEIDTMVSSHREKTIFLSPPTPRYHGQESALGRWIATTGRGDLEFGVFQGTDGRMVTLTAERPTLEAYRMALRAFFRRRDLGPLL